LDGVQTSLVVGDVPELEEFKKENIKPIKYLLEKYQQWKKLKERDTCDGVQEPETV